MARAPSIEILYEALASEFGLILQTDNPDSARQKLYALRRDAKDPDLESLSIMTSPTNPAQDLWIVVRKTKDETERKLSVAESNPKPAEG